jgi:hypothetical protein
MRCSIFRAENKLISVHKIGRKHEKDTSKKKEEGGNYMNTNRQV